MRWGRVMGEKRQAEEAVVRTALTPPTPLSNELKRGEGHAMAERNGRILYRHSKPASGRRPPLWLCERGGARRAGVRGAFAETERQADEEEKAIKR